MNDNNSLPMARAHAQDALSHARLLTDPDQKRSWTELASAWLMLIEALEQLEDRLASPTPNQKQRTDR
jgi:hypothetical protein